MSDIERIPVSTPFGIGPVNCYLLPGDRPVLIDPGPATEAAYAALEERLTATGCDIADIQDVLVTHEHMDHFGLIRRIKHQSGARVHTHEQAVEVLADHVRHFEQEREFFGPYLRSMGVPDRVATVATELPEPYLAFQEPVTVDNVLSDGDSIALDPAIEVVHTPGHSPGSVCFYAPEGEWLLTGDHLLTDITPNPAMTVQPGRPTKRFRALPQYVDSLRALTSYDSVVGHGGHRDPVSDVRTRALEVIDHHESRADDIMSLLEAEGPLTAYEIMGNLFSDLPVTEVFLGMSEVIGHLDLLEDAARIENVQDGDVVRIRAT
jgi:glyoxylase-like metal-dependent hydrolase (beta-lactamase superfamily II)